MKVLFFIVLKKIGGSQLLDVLAVLRTVLSTPSEHMGMNEESKRPRFVQLAQIFLDKTE